MFVGSLMITSLHIYCAIQIFAFNAESVGERILRIGQHLAKLWARRGFRVFLLRGYWVLSASSDADNYRHQEFFTSYV